MNFRMTLDAHLRSLPGRCSGCGYDIATQTCHCGGSEWDIFRRAIKQAATSLGVVHQRDVRPLIRGRIEPKHIGAMYRRAVAEGLLVQIGWEQSSDVAGRNGDKMSRVYEMTGRAS